MSGLVDSLRELVAEPAQVSDGESVLDHYGRGPGIYEHRPDAVVFARSTEEVAAVVEYAAASGVPVVPYGAGTSLSGVVIPIHGGISLDVAQMNRVLAVSPQDFTVTVQPGVLRRGLNDHLRDFGLFFPVDPGADASLGGMCATNASGTTTVRYGSMRGNVRALEVVVGDGSVIRPGVRAKKSSAGYDLVNLFVGSEGTLGVITEVTVRVYPILERNASMRAAFADVESASRAVVALIGAGVQVTRTELLDGPSVAAINVFNQTTLPEQPALLIEIGGSDSTVREELADARALCEGEGAIGFETYTDPTAQAKLWRMRHDFSHAMSVRHPGCAKASTDICVPVSELPGAIAHARERAVVYGFGTERASLLAHAGDGNFHLSCALDPEDPEASDRFNQLSEEMIDYAIARGGTCSGEHGIGIRGIPFLERQHPDLIPWMRAIKAVFDPQGIFNPGKVLAAPQPVS